MAESKLISFKGVYLKGGMWCREIDGEEQEFNSPEEAAKGKADKEKPEAPKKKPEAKKPEATKKKPEAKKPEAPK